MLCIQAALQRSLAASFKVLWTTPLADVDDVLETLYVPTPDDNDEDSDANCLQMKLHRITLQ